MSNILEVLSQNIQIDKEKCIFCGKCAEVCIIDNIRLKLAPCSEACPLGLNCQGYAQLIVRGDDKKAFEVIWEKLPFPGIIGRACHHPCEKECKRNEVDQSGVALRALKRYLADTQDNGQVLEMPEKELTKNVAIVGGGPSGLMAAYELRKRGYQVDLYEAGGSLGGMMYSSIPEFKLPKAVVMKETGRIEAMGVKVHYHSRVGKDLSLETLAEKYEAVLLAVGMQKDKKLGLAGEENENVYGALEFLQKAKIAQKELKVGKNVLVIGGGNTAINAAQTAYRLGAETIRIVCLEDRDSMPAYTWEIADALEEGFLIENGWGPEAFIADKGRVTGVKLKRCLEVYNKQGYFTPTYCDGETMQFPVDTVIVAVGMESDLQLAAESLIEIQDGVIHVDPITKQTAMANIFAAGDATAGPKTIVDAMAQGREAAESIYRYLEQLPLSYDRDRFTGCDLEFTIDTSMAEPIPPVVLPKLQGQERCSFKETEMGMSKEQALMAAKRCLSCGEPHGKFRTCWSCLPCEVECPQEALYVKIPYLMR